jgi:hypothetical protein
MHLKLILIPTEFRKQDANTDLYRCRICPARPGDKWMPIKRVNAHVQNETHLKARLQREKSRKAVIGSSTETDGGSATVIASGSEQSPADLDHHPADCHCCDSPSDDGLVQGDISVHPSIGNETD